MDRNVSTPVKNNLFGTTWKSDITNLIDFKEKFLRVKNIELYLPYVAYRSYPDSKLDFMYIDEKSHKNLIKHTKPHSIFYMTLFLREGYNKQTFGIELKAGAVVIPQRYTRKKWYYYEWNKHELTIRRILGTYDVNKIERMIEELMQEYKRFYYMYCNTN